MNGQRFQILIINFLRNQNIKNQTYNIISGRIITRQNKLIRNE